MVSSTKRLALLAFVSLLSVASVKAQSPIDNSGLYHVPTGSPDFQQNHSTAAVTFDQHSLFLNGQRVMIYSGEYHPWRTPTGEVLWRDVLEKIKVSTQRPRTTFRYNKRSHNFLAQAGGFSAISIYLHWGLSACMWTKMIFIPSIATDPMISPVKPGGAINLEYYRSITDFLNVAKR